MNFTEWKGFFGRWAVAIIFILLSVVLFWLEWMAVVAWPWNNIFQWKMYPPVSYSQWIGYGFHLVVLVSLLVFMLYFAFAGIMTIIRAGGIADDGSMRNRLKHMFRRNPDVYAVFETDVHIKPGEETSVLRLRRMRFPLDDARRFIDNDALVDEAEAAGTDAEKKDILKRREGPEIYLTLVFDDKKRAFVANEKPEEGKTDRNFSRKKERLYHELESIDDLNDELDGLIHGFSRLKPYDQANALSEFATGEYIAPVELLMLKQNGFIVRKDGDVTRLIWQKDGRELVMLAVESKNGKHEVVMAGDDRRDTTLKPLAPYLYVLPAKELAALFAA